MNWISVNNFLPGKNVGWVIVRCINKELDNFYFMAYFDNTWNFIDVFNDEIKVTHWAIPDDVIDDDKWENIENE